MAGMALALVQHLSETAHDHQVALFSAAQAQQIDVLAIAEAAGGYDLMKQAGEAVFQTVLTQWPSVRQLLILCGKGNNGGDGFVVATLAAQHGIAVQLVLTCDINELKGAAKQAAEDAFSLGLRVIKPADIKWPPQPDDCFLDHCFVNNGVVNAGVVDGSVVNKSVVNKSVVNAGVVDGSVVNKSVVNKSVVNKSVIIDALFGTGLASDIRAPVYALIEQTNAAKLPVVSVDIPSGINATSGALQGIAIRADITVTMIVYKQGLFSGAGPVYSGQVRLAPLSVTEHVLADLTPSSYLVNWQCLQKSHFFTQRARDAHKGHFGHVLIIGGDLGMGGAVILAAGAALRSGAGLVSVLTRPEHIGAILARHPEAMAHGIGGVQDVQPLLAQADVIVIGPGLGQGQWGEQLLQQVMAVSTPVVLDADALNILAKGQSRHNLAQRHSVLTPHPGEAARLLEVETAQIQADRLTATAHLAHRYTSSVVLKGLGSLVQTGLQVSICQNGNPGMASGGMGDVLSGIMGSVLAQQAAHLSGAMHELVSSSVCLHSAAADIAGKDCNGQDHLAGLLASDVVSTLRALLH
jgi:hydroxyethylthiazole kinase-like uncharacterized protein yjeF